MNAICGIYNESWMTPERHNHECFLKIILERLVIRRPLLWYIGQILKSIGHDIYSMTSKTERRKE